jgi:pyruvate dehydrogenase E2 component (dihydrolipoamide acetyltransferase)
MSATDVISVEVPDIGDFEDVPIIEIHVSVGDDVAADDPLLTLESDKATMDVPAPFAGTVRELQVSVGDKVSQGTPLLKLEAAGDAEPGGAASAAASDGAPSEASAPEAVASAVDAESESAAPPAGGAQPEAPSAPAEGDRAPSAPAESDGAPASEPQAAAGNGHRGPIYASPAVRRLAREMSVDLMRVEGTGRKGRITKQDVEQFAEGGTPATDGRAPAPSGAPAGLDLPPWPTIDFTKFGEVERVERSRIQRISGPSLARNWVMIPHVTHNDEADITELEAWRKRLNSEQDVKVTMVSFLVVASVAALKAFPTFNSSLNGDELVLKRYYNIGFAADTPGGLVVPVIKDADKKGLLEIAAELGALSAKARDGKLGPADMQGSTFTISSLGGIGGTSFTPIVNAPEVAILGVTRSAMKPVWNGSEFQPRLMVPLSLSYDHRVIDGAAAARFVVHLVGVLSDLKRALL